MFNQSEKSSAPYQTRRKDNRNGEGLKVDIMIGYDDYELLI